MEQDARSQDASPEVETAPESTGQAAAVPAQPGARRPFPWLGAGLIGSLLFFAVSILALAVVIVLVARGDGQAALGGDAVGIIEVQGIIAPGSSSPGGVTGAVAGSETIIELINQANEDERIKAIVLRVDSPGGGVVASDEIHHALLSVEKPIVVSMGTVAASGGYFISAPADYIYATPNTLTGSIGVISQFITADELLDEVGIEVVTITSGDLKDFGSLSRTMSEEEQAYWQAIVGEIYGDFVDVVVQGRGLDEETVRSLADGRVYTGTQALELGLVDEIGYLEDALAKAAELANLGDDYEIIDVAPPPSPFEELLGVYSAGSTQAVTFDTLRELSMPTIEYRYVGPAFSE